MIVNGWIILAVDRGNDGWILDHSENLAQMLTEGIGAEDNNIYMDPNRRPGLYRIDTIKISGGGWSGGDSPEWDAPEISGRWVPLMRWKDNGAGYPV